tara:strand:+ start:29 stop:373 length:345 start_codon:yes stop_codon:yes gene_type:complete
MSIELNITEKNVIISDFKVGSIIEYNNNGDWIPAEIINIHHTFEHSFDFNIKEVFTLPYYTILFPNKNTSSEMIRNACTCGNLIPQRIIQANHTKLRKKQEDVTIFSSIFSLFH